MKTGGIKKGIKESDLLSDLHEIAKKHHVEITGVAVGLGKDSVTFVADLEPSLTSAYQLARRYEDAGITLIKVAGLVEEM